MAINLERSEVVVNARTAPTLKPRTMGWYVTDEGEARAWHLGQQWETPEDPRAPREIWTVPAVIEFCQGEVAVTGRGAGALVWHGPFRLPNDDIANVRVCGTCARLAEQLKTEVHDESSS